jgi:hypothetical protein
MVPQAWIIQGNITPMMAVNKSMAVFATIPHNSRTNK